MHGFGNALTKSNTAATIVKPGQSINISLFIDNGITKIALI